MSAPDPSRPNLHRRAGAGSASAAVAALADEFWEGVLRWDPVYATIIGDRRFDHLLDDHAPDARAARRRDLASLLERAAAVDGATLPQADVVTLEVLRSELRGQLDAIDAAIDDWTVDPLSGLHTSILELPDYQPIATPDQADAYLARLRAVAPALDEHGRRLRESLAAGQVAVHQPVARVIDELLETAWAAPADWSLVRPAIELEQAPPDGWPAASIARFRADLERLVADELSPAYARLWELLRAEILPHARPPERAGLVHVPGGTAAYPLMVRHHTTTSSSPEELHRIGLDELARIDAELVALGRRVLGTSDLPTTLARLRGDPALHFATRAEILAAAGTFLAAATAATPAWFGRLPVAPCELAEVPAWSEAHQTIAYYSWPAADGSRPGRYFVNLSEPATRPRYEAAALAFHEAVPGHHTQLALAQELTHLPAFRRFLAPTAYAEGWGLYAERLADEMGLYPTDLDRIGILSYDAWRAGRLVVDTGMHAFGWSRDQAIAVLTEHTALGDNNIRNEVDRYIVWPGQALAYKVGQLELLRLRSRARSLLGDRFDIRGFHDAVLAEGALPLSVLARQVERWIEAQAAAIPG